MRTLGVTILCISLCTLCHAMTPRQQWALYYAGSVGSPYGTTLQAIIWQESSLCANKVGKHHDYGCGQIQAAAIKAVWGMRVGKYALIHDDILNIHIAAAYLQYCITSMGSWARGVYCYNRGPGVAAKAKWYAILHDAYVRHIQHRMHQVKVYLKKHADGSLRPDDGLAEAELGRLKPGDVVQADITKPRNPKFHRKYFALLKVAFDNQDKYVSPDAFREEVEILCGHYELHTHIDGSVSINAKSIAFSKMDDVEFSRLYSQTIDVIIAQFIPGTDPDDLAREADEILGFA